MVIIPALTNTQLEDVCKVLADMENGLTGLEVGYLLAQLSIPDQDPHMPKWKRLYNALLREQQNENNGSSVCRLIEAAMDPVRFLGQNDKFEERRNALNQVIAFSGYSLGADGKLLHGEDAISLIHAEERANRLRTELQRRGVHYDVLNVCEARFLQKDYFHAVQEAAKSVADKIRLKSGLTLDGAQLVDKAFGIPRNGFPLLAFNALQTNIEKSEHKGLAYLTKGLLEAFRNISTRQTGNNWPVLEQDAIDLLTIASLIHRRLDTTIHMPSDL